MSAGLSTAAMIRAARTIFSLEKKCQLATFFAPNASQILEMLVPGLANVDDIDSIRAGLPEVRFHVNLQVLASKVSSTGEQHLNVLRRGIEDRGKLGRSHLCGLTVWLWEFRGGDLEVENIIFACAKISS